MESNRDFKGIWIPREVWLDERLNALEKIILMEIDSLDLSEKGCYASNKYLSEFCQCSETKISKAVTKLIDLGYIELKSFDGRLRILQSRISQNAKQTCKKCKADLQIMQDINNSIINNNNIKKESKKAVDYDMLINNYTSNADLKSELTEFIKMRKLIKKPMTNQALTLTFSKLDKYGKTDEEKIMILQNSIMNSWQGVFPLKDEKQTPTYQKKENKKLTQSREYTKEQLDSAFSSLDDLW